MSASREKRLRRELREAEANSDTVKKEKKQKKKLSYAKKKKLRSVIGTIIGILVVVAFALLIFVNSGVLQTKSTALTIGSHKLTPTQFNYFYQDTYTNIKNTYTSYGYWDYMVDTTKPLASQECFLSDDGSTWSEYIRESAIASAVQIYALYDAAEEAGYTLDEDTQAELDTVPDEIATYAEQSDFKDADDYLEEFYGKGASMDSYMEYLTVQQLASGYATEKSESFSYTDEELRTYYNDNKQDFDKVTYRVFTVTTEDDDSNAAMETAEAMAALLDGTEKSFADAAYEYAPEDSKESYEDEDYTLRSNYSYSSLSSDYADWLFSEERVEGESEVFPTSTGYAVVMFVSRDNNEYRTVDVRHILVNVAASGDDGTSTEADWEDCKAKIEEIQEEWEATDMTEDDFAALAEEKSEDTGSSSNGGLYEDVYKGQMVTEFNDWCFDETHEPGDYGIVKSDYGYHLIYFSGYGDEYWKTLADSSKRSEDYNAWYEEYSADYTGDSSFFGMLFTHKTLAV